MRLDNSTLRFKIQLRRRMLAARDPAIAPCILETHGGWGRVFDAVYADVPDGVVFEKNECKAEQLARQRPTWQVYACDCEPPLAAGMECGLVFNVLDVDPYGSPFPVIAAALSNPKTLDGRIDLVVNDGLRNNVRMGGAWPVACLEDIVRDFGNNLYANYLQAAKEKVRRIAADSGYRLTDWYGYHCGNRGDMTHYWATLVRGTG